MKFILKEVLEQKYQDYAELMDEINKMKPELKVIAELHRPSTEEDGWGYDEGTCHAGCSFNDEGGTFVVFYPCKTIKVIKEGLK